ncbi:DUF5132 domain-containing protein [Lyngbya sp. PCC 8106]|uniref:DUF5132 domain-containing protein n=1 Tax=Lyngbya sp. (strain PCC 8106) TaxID=313612 RepID=UPI0000EA8FBD|nr:DUF5132 domain-containing protein [Lyngbya sp. PCC 8106]EAW34492.1 hypothetical protein L8106_03429 [Lyngbya sp. PCC 8106]
MAHLHLLRTFKQTSVTTAAVGVGALILVPLLVPVAKTVAKASIKSGVKLYHNGQKALAEVGELWEDTVAEAEAELAAENPGKQTVDIQASAN